MVPKKTKIEVTRYTKRKPKIVRKSRVKVADEKEVVNVRKYKEVVYASYTIPYESVTVKVRIKRDPREFVKIYELSPPVFAPATQALLADLKNEIIASTNIPTGKVLDAAFLENLKNRFKGKAASLLEKEIPGLNREDLNIMLSSLIQEMLGLGKMEYLLNDSNLEEIAVNSSNEPIWVYHKKFGWLKTNILIPSELDIQNYANIIARRVGRQITNLNPLLDAHLVTGDRANATLYPVSTEGNSITIRRFRRDPWTIVDLMKNKTLSSEIASLIWLAMESELNILISGGTGSGKTSFLNVCMPFIQPNHRVISIEDTRELQLPEYLHWVPMVTREPNPEGKGEVGMLDLMVNSLRMRPDRILVGEIRRRPEAEVLFEAMQTGHSVYSTFHANTAEQTVRRLTNDPISIPPSMLEALHLNIVMFRNRRTGIRRVFQVSEVLPSREGFESGVSTNSIYRYRPRTDDITKHNNSVRFFDEIALHTSLTPAEIRSDLLEKDGILKWLSAQGARNVNQVGKVMAVYYSDKDFVLDAVAKNVDSSVVLDS